MSPVYIIDYGVGNLLNVSRAFKACGVEAKIVPNPEDLKHADHVVLPGVGAFNDGISELRRRGFEQGIKDYIKTGKPFLGICLGMQLLLDESEEFGVTTGLGLIPGRVVKIPDVGTDGVNHKIPHIGWNNLVPSNSQNWEGGLLKNVERGASVYFVHSYMVQPKNPGIVTSHVDYDGVTIPATLQFENISAAQFHPERSAEAGLKMLRSFAEL